MNFKIILNQMKFFAFIFIFSASFFLFSSSSKASPQYFTRSMENNFLFTLKINHLIPSGEEEITHHLFGKNLETIAENNIDYPLIEGKEYTISITAHNVYGNFKSSFFQKGSPLSVFINGVRASESFGETGFKSTITKSFTFTPYGNELILESVLENCKIYQFTGTNELQYRIVFPVKAASHTLTLKEDLDGKITKLTDDSNPTLVKPNTKLNDVPALPPANKENYFFLGYFKEIIGNGQPSTEQVEPDSIITEDTTIIAKYTLSPVARTGETIFWGENLREAKYYIENADRLTHLAEDATAFLFKEADINTKPSSTGHSIFVTVIVNYKDGKKPIEVPVAVQVLPLSEKFTPVTTEISVFWGEQLHHDSKTYIDNSNHPEGSTSFRFKNDDILTKVDSSPLLVPIIARYEDGSEDEVILSVQIKPLNQKYLLSVKENVSQTVGLAPLPPAEFIKNATENESLPENTSFRFLRDFDWNKVGKQTAKVLVTFEDKSTSEFEVSLTLKSVPNIIYYPVIPDTSAPINDEKTDSKEEELKEEIKEAKDSMPEKREEVNELDVEEEMTAKGEATPVSSKEEKKDKGNAPKSETLSVEETTIPKGQLNGIKSSNFIHSKDKTVLAKTGGKKVNTTPLFFSILILFISILGITFFTSKTD